MPCISDGNETIDLVYGQFPDHSIPMVLMWKRALLASLLILGSLQFFQVFFTHCWICKNNTFLNGELPLEWRQGDYYANPASGRRSSRPATRSYKPKVQQSVFGRYQNTGVSLWDDFDSEGLSSRLHERFDINGSDVLVFLHIQKTGGTAFGKNLVQNLVDPSSGQNACLCKQDSKKCKCNRPGNTIREWLFSRFSTGWKCGLHADWTELTNCVDQVLDQKEGSPQKRRYFYMTLLRDPFQRYLSEFLHVQRGATWRTSRHWCGGRFASISEIRPCFENDSWEGCTLDEFLQCPDNLATNRATRMLADLSLVGCYNKSFLSQARRDTLMLASAKKNLRKMAFFGIVEDIKETQLLFEHTFGFKFTEKLNGSYEARGENYSVDAKQKAEMMNRVSLDMQLYDYAKVLFKQRLRAMMNLVTEEEKTPMK